MRGVRVALVPRRTEGVAAPLKLAATLAVTALAAPRQPAGRRPLDYDARSCAQVSP
jgi:hypothetical protein